MEQAKESNNLFSSPIRGTFIGAFVLTALTYFASISVYLMNNYEEDFFRMLRGTYSHFHGLSLGLFTPLLIASTSALLVKFYLWVNKALAGFKVAKYAITFGLFMAYLLITFMGTLGILYFS
jgi:hypothetical protein